MEKGKIILQGTIQLLSPTVIGNGEKELTDNDVLLDNKGKPFIPATSFVGVLRHFIKLDNPYNEKLDQFWGFTLETKGQQSSLFCSDLTCLADDPKIVIRDGIAINIKKGIVEKDAKYDYQVIERGTQFHLNMEVTLTDTNKTFSKQMIATIRQILENGDIKLGAKTNSGLGKIRLKDTRICEFDFNKKGDVLRWLKRDISTANPFTEEAFRLQKRNFSINANFKLKTSFISRSYSVEPGAPDAVSIKSGDDFVMPGTTLKGAIRSRAERIVNTLGKSQDIIFSLFGKVDEKTKEKSKGRITIDEVILPKFPSELQTRIKIDRFTGGTIESALFETMPLFSDTKDTQIENLRISIADYKDHEAGLMLLVLKDLWTGDLAIGGEKNIGRGAMEGIQAEIRWDNETVILDEGLKGLTREQEEKLGQFVAALQDL